MDKSEGKDFISKTFGKVGEKTAKIFHKVQNTLSLSSIKRNRIEKLSLLGGKVYEMLEKGEVITKETIKDEFESVAAVERALIEAVNERGRLKNHKSSDAKGFDVETLEKEDAPVKKERGTKPKSAAEETEATKKTRTKRVEKDASVKSSAKSTKAKAKSVKKDDVEKEPVDAGKEASDKKPVARKTRKPAAKKTATTVKVEDEPTEIKVKEDEITTVMIVEPELPEDNKNEDEN